MILGLIPRPQQPSHDIDTYFKPLVEDLKELWYNNGVQVCDEHNREYFGLKVILFVILQRHVTCQDRARKYVADVHIVLEKQTHSI
jgi:hypothetical protein